jgi:type I restriction enzyme, S subunit
MNFSPDEYEAYSSDLHNDKFRSIARWTTNIAHLGADRFANLEFPLPATIEQEQIVAEIEQRFSIADE